MIALALLSALAATPGQYGWLEDLTGAAEIRSYKDSSDWRVRAAIARNVNAPTDVLVECANDAHAHVRASVARNPALKEAHSHKLAEDVEWHVRQMLARNKSTAEADKEKLRVAPDDRVRTAILEEETPVPLSSSAAVETIKSVEVKK